MDTRPDSVIMLLAGGVIGPLTDIVISGLAVSRAETFAEVAPVSYATDVWSGTAFVPGIVVSADVDENVWATAMTVVEFITLLASSEEVLLFCLIAFCCRPIAATLGCRALQA